MTDWLATLREQAKVGEQMAEEVSRMRSNPDISLQQVSRLYNALERQAQFTKKLAQVLEESGHNFTVVEVVEAAEALEELRVAPSSIAVIIAETARTNRRYSPRSMHKLSGSRRRTRLRSR